MSPDFVQNGVLTLFFKTYERGMKDVVGVG
jgi:hypothetical protein